MTPEAKVVSLREPEAGRNLIPAPLVRLRDQSAGWLQNLLDEFFDQADDALFRMSEKAASNREQTAFFDAMRELRLQRRNLILSYLQWVARSFNEVGRFESKSAVQDASGTDADRDSLSLVADDALEQQVALDNLITKIRNGYNEQILLLHVRIEHLLPAIKLPLASTPLGPEVLCHGLAEAFAGQSLDINAKLVVFKLFDKFLVDRLDELYQQANNLLAGDGVLPELRRPPTGRDRKSQQQKRHYASAAASQATAGEQEAGYEGGYEGEGAGPSITFSQLSSLLQGTAFANDFPAARAGYGGNVSTDHLVGLLSGFQGKLQDPQIRMPAGSDLGKLVAKLVAYQQSGKGQVERVDADVVNLVSMLFDFILEDRQLPEAMKALLARLQIPILKIALLDRNFFNRGGHPARKLLNELALAAVGWMPKPEGQRDPLRDKIEEVVHRLIHEFDSDVALVQDLLDDFGHFMDLDRRRRDLIEQRLRDAEEGRARSLQARAAVTEIVARRRESHTLPEGGLPLLEAWSMVLHWYYLREGEEGENWAHAIATLELLLWSLDPKPLNEGTRPALLKAIPQVVDSVREGLQTIGWDPFGTDQLIRELEMAHVDVLQGIDLLQQEPPEEPAPETEPRAASAPEAGAHEAQPLRPKPAPAVTEPLAIPASAPETVEAGVEKATPPTVQSPSGAQASVAVADEADAQAERVTAEMDPRWQQQAESLGVGSWLELQDQGARKLRCKLAAIIKATGKYIFANRNGTKVAEYRLAEVADLMCRGQLVVLDDGLIFDRALESVIGNLRNSRRD